jgi:hypothetical protein
MSHMRFVLVLGVVLGAAALGVAQEKTIEKTIEKRPPAKAIDDVPPKPDVPAKAAPGKADVSTSPTPKRAATGEKVLRVHLMEGSVVSGKLSVSSIMVDTEFGKLEVPVTRIVSFTPGLDSHPKHREQVRTLVLQLGANDKALRDLAEKELGAMGHSIKQLLEQFRDDKDTERRNRVTKILEEIDQQAEEENEATRQHVLIDDDTIQTASFTMVGKISPQSFQLQTKFGPLTVNLSDIRRAEHESDEKPEFRKTIEVPGNNLAVRPLNSGIKVNKGDKVELEASGSVVMSPWGSEQASGPEGGANFGQYKPGINGGALVMRYGPNGTEELVGRSKKFTATKSATLFFFMAMQPQFAAGGYQFPGSYKVKVKINQQ